MTAGKAAIDKAMAMKAPTDRERQFITALNAYYHAPEGPRRARLDNPAMGQSDHAIE